MARPAVLNNPIRKVYYLGEDHRAIIEKRVQSDKCTEGEALRRILTESQNLETDRAADPSS